ncbi:hypothetical protein AA0119_g11515 [Alternaria tenuissima]|uniref:C2H2-type domain-containing protein n=2 Tax=Alternaria alternata complex TaxID=187734 RepID=A0A4V1WPZ3_ALTAL|nr:hypothetical protein AA0117_g12273 [Alternaria alternata]RYN89278.1 hypothetical protein AA0119_g11515 [Alternaria tenuissima]RYO04881.1 hypothetical protein AA0121_g12608 [Alternaria tenuissima]
MMSVCLLCDRSFPNHTALQQHERDSPAHAESFDCDECDRSFGSEEALAQHLRDSPIHRQVPETPLDIFFRSFRTFAYDPTQPPATSYAFLQAHEGWRRGEAASTAAWNLYQEALEDELRLWFGDEDDLAAWHALCHAIGVEPPPQTCGQCEEAVRRTHVNILDLVEWGRSRGSNEDRVQTFSDVAGLRAYTRRTGKVFRNTLGQTGGNVVLRHLLRRIFRESS